MDITGRRLPDTRFGDLPDDPQPGDIWKCTHPDGTPLSAKEMFPQSDVSGNLTDCVWTYYSPDGNGMGTLALHTVREEDDGTVSIRPGDGSSNSVLHHGGATGKTWHGYVEHNVWTAC